MNRDAAIVTVMVLGIVLIATLGEGGASALGGTILHGVVAIAVATTFGFGLSGERTVLPRRPVWAFLVFVGLAVTGAALVPGFFAAWLVLIELATFIGVAWLAARCGDGLMSLLSFALAMGAGAHGCFALIQRVVGGDPRPPSTFLNVNHFAAWLVAAFLLAGARVASPDRRGRWWIAILLIPAAAALGLSGSRGAAIGLLCGGAVLVAMSWHRLERRLRLTMLSAVAVVGVAVAAGIVLRFRTPDPFPYQRIGIAKAAWQLAIERPFTGSGPGQFATAAANLNFPVEDAPLRYARVFATPHSDWLRAPAEFGWPAAVALAVALAFVARVIGARRRENRPIAGALAALTALAVQALFDDLTTRPALVVLAAALFGALLAARRSEPSISWPAPSRWAFAALILFGFAVGDLAPYLALREGSPRRNPLSPALWARRAEEIVTSPGDLDLSRYLRGREAAERAQRLDPSDARWVLTLARVEGLGVRSIFRDVAGVARVAELYTRAAALARTNALIPLDAALFLRGGGDLEGARREAERCLALEPRAIAPRLILAAIALDAGEVNASARALALVAEAEALAKQFASLPRSSIYERRLLALDPRDAAVLRERARMNPS